MLTHHKEEKACRVYVFVIGTIIALIVTGALIYLCIYLTDYRPNTNPITLQSMTNGTNHTSKNVKLAAIAVNDTGIAVTANKLSSKTINEEDDDDTVLIKAAIPSFTKADVPSFTQVVVPSKSVKKVVYIPENIVLQNVTPPHI